MKVCNKQDEYSEEWDTLLNWLLDNGLFSITNAHILEVNVLTKKGWLFDKYDTYSIWIGNKKCAYGSLHDKNAVSVSRGYQNKPKQSTMERLYQVECKVNEIAGLYAIPKKVD